MSQSMAELRAENERMRLALERIRKRVLSASRYDGEERAYFHLGAIGVDAAVGLGDPAALASSRERSTPHSSEDT